MSIQFVFSADVIRNLVDIFVSSIHC